MNSERGRRVMITRPQEDAAVVAEALQGLGITPVLAPMMETKFLPQEIDIDLKRAQAVLFTSRNGIRSFSRVSAQRDIRVFAVGDSTASLATENGFTSVQSAAGDSADLARLVTKSLSPSDGPLLHVAGKTVAGDLAETLSADGFELMRHTLYEARPLRTLAADTAKAIRTEEIDYVLFFSPRTARIFSDLVKAAGLTEHCRKFEAICLSDAVALELRSTDWKARRTAENPTSDSLLKTVTTAVHDGKLEPGGPEDTLPPQPISSERTDPTAQTGYNSDIVDLAPLQQAVQRAAASADTPRPSTPHEDDTSTAENPMTESALPKTDRPATEEQDTKRPAAGVRSRVSILAWTLVLICLVAIAGYLTLPIWQKILPPYLQERLAGVQKAVSMSDKAQKGELAALRSENNALKSAVKNLGRDFENAQSRMGMIDEIAARQSRAEKAINDLSAKLKSDLETASRKQAATASLSLASRIDALEKELSRAVAGLPDQAEAPQKLDTGATPMSARINALEANIAALQTAVAKFPKTSQSPSRIDAFVLAASQLRDALSRGVPFEAEIATLKNLSGDNADIAAAIAPIENLAAKGTPSRSALLARLPAVVEAILETKRPSGDMDWIDRSVSRLRGFVRVRRVDGKGGGPNAIIARAEIAAARGDLKEAVSELSKLGDKAAASAQTWLYEARARLSAETAEAALNRILLNKLSPAN